MSLDLATLGIEFNTTGLEKGQAALNATGTAALKAADAADKLGEKAGAAGKKAGEGLQKVGESGGTAARTVQADTEKIVASVEKVRKASESAGVAAGISAKQTAAALRGVPAQFTDIAVGLQGGQSPLTVLLQQGGQLKDMFGGIGPAAKALGGYVLGLVNPFTVGAAAVGALAFAYYKGSQEGAEFSKAIITSGNAAGTTANQLQDYAQNMAKISGTRGAAAEALTEFAASGKVGNDNLQDFAQAAMQWEKATGQSVANTVKQFSELGKSPVEASIKLNEQYGYLTTSVYKQIKALEDAGKTTEAADLAQRTFADTIKERSGQIASNVGLIETAWMKVKGAISGAGDALLNIGRAATPAEQLKTVQDRIAVLQNRQAASPFMSTTPEGAAFGSGRNHAKSAGDAAELSSLQAQAAALGGVAYMQQMAAEQTAKQTEQTKARIEWDKTGAKFLSDKVKQEREITAERNRGIAAGASEEEIARRIADIKRSYNKSGGGQSGESEVAGLQARIVQEQELLRRLRERGTEADKLTSGEQAVMKIQAELATSISGVTRARKLEALGVAEKLAAVEKERVGQEQTIKAVAKARDETFRQIEAVDRSGAAIRQQAEDQEAANAVWGKGKTAIEEMRLAQMQATLAQVDATDSADPAYIASLNAKIAAQERYVASLKGGDLKTLDSSLDTYRDETKVLAMTNAEREVYIRLREVERAGYAKGTPIYDRSEQRIREAVREREEMQAAGTSQVDMWKAIDNAGRDAFTNIGQAGKSVFDRLKDSLQQGVYALLYEMTVRKWLISISTDLIGPGQTQKVFGTSGGSLFGSALKGTGGYQSAAGFTPDAGLVANASDYASEIGLSSGSSGVMSEIGNWFSSLFKFADGGNPPMGRPSIVGERGIELFVPKQPGTIIPNHALGAIGGGQALTYAPVINIDSRTDQAQVRSAVMGALAENNKAWAEQLKRSGVLQ